jgi:hypothetical protein
VTILISCTVFIIGIPILVGVGIIKTEKHIDIKTGTDVTIHIAVVVLELVQKQMVFV